MFKMPISLSYEYVFDDILSIWFDDSSSASVNDFFCLFFLKYGGFAESQVWALKWLSL